MQCSGISLWISYTSLWNCVSCFESGVTKRRSCCGCRCGSQAREAMAMRRAHRVLGAPESDPTTHQALLPLKKQMHPGAHLVEEVIHRGLLHRFPQSKTNSHCFMTQPWFFFSSISLVPLTQFLLCAQPTLKHRMLLGHTCLLIQFLS